MFNFKLDKEKEQYFQNNKRELELLSSAVNEESNRIEDKVLLMPLQYKYSHNLITGNFENVEGVDRILGYENKMFTLQFYYGILHPDDLEITFEMTRKGTFWAENSSNVNPYSLQLNVLQKIRRADQEYAYVFRQSIVTCMIRNKIARTLSVCTDVTAMGMKSMKPAFLYMDKEVNFNHTKVFDRLSEKYYQLLTQREIDVLFWVLEGYTSSVIANNLNISKHTVDTHRRNIRKKTGMKTIFELREIFLGSHS